MVKEHNYSFIEEMRVRVLLALLRIIEIHESSIDTTRHSDRVATVSILVAGELNLSYEECAVLWRACLLHDLGKVGILADVLGSKKKLTHLQRSNVQSHPQIAQEVLKILNIYDSEALIIRQHHENFNGTGYPDKLSGDDIHLCARIIHIADVYDALTTFRGYKKQWNPVDSIEYVYRQSGKMFDPDIVKVYMRISESEKFRNIYY